jgi:hypothetical protein
MPTTSDQDKPSTRQEYQVKRSITLDPTVGLCSNFAEAVFPGVEKISLLNALSFLSG